MRHAMGAIPFYWPSAHSRHWRINTPRTGAAAVASPLSSLIGNAAVTIGGVPAPVGFAGLAPGFVGLYQVNVQVPQGVAAGDAVPVMLSTGATVSNVVTISVR